MTPEERDDLLRNAPPEDGLEAKYEHLLHAFEEQERTATMVARALRLWDDVALTQWADILDPPEPLSEADAAEKFSRDCAGRKPPAT